MQSPSKLSLKDQGRDRIMKLIREYKRETGQDAISKGKITKDFQEWRKLRTEKE